MIKRYISPKLIDRLNKCAFWQNIIGDPDLHPEIRNDKITVYYRASAFLHELRLSKGDLVAGVSRAYIPLEDEEDGGRSEVDVHVGGRGLVSFERKLRAVELGSATREIRDAFKRRIREVQGKHAEGAIVQAMCDPKKNTIVDQEVSFVDEGGSVDKAKADKIDLCCYEPAVNKFVFVEVKRLDDKRMRAGRDTEAEVIGQLRGYGQRIKKGLAHLPKVFEDVVRLKRAIGMRERYDAVPEEGGVGIVEKPALVVGNCSSDVIRRILSGDQPDFPKIDEIAKVASALFLCRDNGCTIRMVNGAYQRVFSE